MRLEVRLVYHDVSELQGVVVTDVIGVVLHLREERGSVELQRLVGSFGVRALHVNRDTSHNTQHIHVRCQEDSR